MDGLPRPFERRRRYLAIYASEGGEEKIVTLINRVFSRIVRLYKKIERNGKDRDSVRALRALVPIYKDLIFSGIFLRDDETLDFIYRLERIIHVPPEQKRIARAIARLSR